MALSPYYSYIQRYFPESEWGRANCVSLHECDPSRDGYPATCIGDEGFIDCSGNPTNIRAKSWGPFQILDACWNPDLNPNSPFTPQQWAKVLDPNVNTWMASVIWSGGGWRAWSTCDYCDACQVRGGPIPYPRGPIEDQIPPPPPPPPPDDVMNSGVDVVLPLAIGGVLIAGAISVWRKGKI